MRTCRRCKKPHDTGDFPAVKHKGDEEPHPGTLCSSCRQPTGGHRPPKGHRESDDERTVREMRERTTRYPTRDVRATFGRWRLVVVEASKTGDVRVNVEDVLGRVPTRKGYSSLAAAVRWVQTSAP